MIRPPIRFGRLAAFLLLCLLASLATYHHQNTGRNTHILDLILPQTSFDGRLANDIEATALCKSASFPTLPQTLRQKRRVYDLFLFSTELDWLEIRLHTLAPYVDYFIIVEATTTFTGLPKPLSLSENWPGFSDFHVKIIHRVIEDPGPSIGRKTWDHEKWQRNALFDSVFLTLAGKEKPTEGLDVLLVSDVDEIPKPLSIAVLRNCDIPFRLTLRSHFYYYSFQWLHHGAQWPHPQATIYSGPQNTISPNDLRLGSGGSFWTRTGQKADLFNAAWHCSSCFATLAAMRRKMESFSHTKWNTAANRDLATIAQRVRGGEDLFGRKVERYDRVEGNEDLPGWVLEEKERFGYLLDRDGEGAGFTDWEAGEGG